MMAVTSKSFISGGALTFVFYGLPPLGLVFYIALQQLRRSRMAAEERLGQPDRADPQPDQDRLL